MLLTAALYHTVTRYSVEFYLSSQAQVRRVHAMSLRLSLFKLTLCAGVMRGQTEPVVLEATAPYHVVHVSLMAIDPTRSLFYTVDQNTSLNQIAIPSGELLRSTYIPVTAQPWMGCT